MKLEVLQVSVPSGNIANYVHAPRGLVMRRLKAGWRTSQASAFKVVGCIVLVFVFCVSDLKM